MPEIKFTNEKADRWLERIAKRESRLTPEERVQFRSIQAIRSLGSKLPPEIERILHTLGKKV